MIDFRDFDDLSDIDRCFVDNCIDKMSDFIPLQDVCDYVHIKKYVRKILEIIERGNDDDKGRD